MKIINTFCTVITMKTSRSISTIQSYSELKELISKNKIARVYLFIGNGPKNQYPDMSTVKSNLKEFFKTSNLRWERRIPESGMESFFSNSKPLNLQYLLYHKWLQLYGGIKVHYGPITRYYVKWQTSDWGEVLKSLLTSLFLWGLRWGSSNFLCSEWGEVPQFHC